MLTRVVYLLLICILAGCGNHPRAPVVDRNARSTSVYLVQRGDTLYSIAFRYGMDYRKMAAANGIIPPYTIYPGQRILLRERALASAPPAAGPQPAVAPKPTPRPVAKPPPVAAPAATSARAGSSGKPVALSSGPVEAWRWPTDGKVVRGFSPSVHKGIDIDGQRGDPIYAVAHGTVVYAGTGIVGMGELLIVKHNDIYLSAYAHNDRLLVVEGERVRAGQKIATKGNSGTDSVKLHFEIRREGKPVDPKSLLPRR